MSTNRKTRHTPDVALKTFADHLGELRGRLAWVALLFLVFSSLAYTVREALISWVLSPIGHQKLVYLTPAGGFSFIFQVTMYAGILATLPFIIYHIYRFIAPALPQRVRSMSLTIVLASTALMVGGVSFGYYVAIPAALKFLTTFAGDFVQANLTADSYLSFVVAYVFGLGLLFQLPLLLIIWNWVNPFKPGDLLNSQRFVLVGAFIAAAMLTPTPDVINQTIVAGPIIAIYQLGVISVFIINRKARRLTAPQRAVVEREVMREMPPVEPQRSRHQPITHTPIGQVVTHQVPRPVHPALKTVDGFVALRPSRDQLTLPSRPQPIKLQTPHRTPIQRRVMPTVRTSIDGFTFSA